MKFLAPLLPILLTFSQNTLAGSVSLADTAIVHSLDGKLTEWPAQKIDTDLATQMKYAIDNDAQYLYIAVAIPTPRLQMRIMRQGMELYLDLKAKKKEGRGVEFPVARDAGLDNSLMSNRNDQATGQETPAQKKAKMKAMRASLALNLASMKLFGFTNVHSDEQGLQMAGSVNIAFAWDSADVMGIEYRIPLSLLEPSQPLSQKEISIGWKLTGLRELMNASRGDHHHNRESGEGENRESYQANTAPGSSENVMEDQSFWTKYVFE